MEPLETIIVTTLNDTTIRGVLRDLGKDFMVLAAAALMGEENGRTVWRSVPGEVVVPMANVDYFQRSVPPGLLSDPV